MTRLCRFLFVGVIVVLLTSACGGDEATATPLPQPTATSTPKPSIADAEPTPTAASEPPADSDATVEPVADAETEDTGEALDLSEVQPDLSDLDGVPLQSYRLRVQWVVEGKEGDEARSEQINLNVAHTSDPSAEEIEFFSEQAGYATKMIRMDDRLWLQAGERWIEVSGDQMDFEQALFTLDSAVGSLAGDAVFVGQETLNGVATLHYRFDESILGPQAGFFTTIQGDVWVAEEGGYVVKYVFTAEDDEASYAWRWEIYDVNAPFTIELPAEAQTPRETLPLLPDATDRSTVGALTTYQTATDQQTAIDFYKEEMSALGWSFDGTASVVSGEFVMLLFAKGEDTVSITLTPEGERLLVVMQRSQ